MPTKKNLLKNLTQERLILELAKEVKSLSENIRVLESEKIFSILNHPIRLMWLSFIKGIMVGFGGVIGATVVIAIFVYLLSQMEFIPIIGDWISQIIQQIGAGT